MTPTRYYELIDLAECSPDSPWIHYPRDKAAQVRWLWGRLLDKGVLVGIQEVAAAMDAFSSQ